MKGRLTLSRRYGVREAAAQLRPADLMAKVGGRGATPGLSYSSLATAIRDNLSKIAGLQTRDVVDDPQAPDFDPDRWEEARRFGTSRVEYLTQRIRGTYTTF